MVSEKAAWESEYLVLIRCMGFDDEEEILGTLLRLLEYVPEMSRKDLSCLLRLSSYYMKKPHESYCFLGDSIGVGRVSKA